LKRNIVTGFDLHSPAPLNDAVKAARFHWFLKVVLDAAENKGTRPMESGMVAGSFIGTDHARAVVSARYFYAGFFCPSHHHLQLQKAG
jgi:hypothetical protein